MAEPSTVVLPRTVAGTAKAQTPYHASPAGQLVRPEGPPNLNQDVSLTRRPASAAAAIRGLYETNGLLSTAIVQALSLADSGFTVRTYSSSTQEFSREGTLACEAILAMLGSDTDYSVGYADKRSLPSVIQSMLLEVALTGGVGLELVLDKNRLPSNLQVLGYDSMTWLSKGNGRKIPTQKDAQGNIIELDYPTIWFSELLKTAQRKYALPMVYSGLQRLNAYETLLQDGWRVITQAGMSRIVISLNYEKVVQSAPPEVRNDPAKLASYLEEVRSVHERVLSDLSPEDSLVTYDLAVVDSIKTTGEKADLAILIDQLSGLASSALKSSPTALGLRLGGSQNVGSIEAMLATKTAALYRGPVQEALSRALTLACRLYGLDVYVELQFKDIDLRPANELEAHKQIQQNRALELLSYGRITDDEMQAMLGLGSLPASAETLSGTMFLGDKRLDTLPVAGVNSLNRQISPEGPTSGGGSSNDPAP